MRVLAVGCHPDDLEINAFGTLIRYVERGDELIICGVANGCMGHMVIMPKELAAIRVAEARNAAKLIGAKEYINLGIDDLSINARDEGLYKKMVDVIRYAKPDVIISHAANDYQRDHNEVHDLVWGAGFDSSIPHYFTENPVHPLIASMYFMEPSASNAFIPTDYVDITNVIDKKLEALACHKSQIDWLRDHVGKDVLETTRAAAMFRGRLSKVKYAEAFLRCDHVLRMTTSRMLP